MNTDLEQLLNNTASWEAFDGFDVYSQRLYKPAVLLKCRTITKNRNIISADGAQLVSKSQLVTAGVPMITVQDRIDGFNALAVDQHFDDNGSLHHIKVFL